MRLEMSTAKKLRTQSIHLLDGFSCAYYSQDHTAQRYKYCCEVQIRLCLFSATAACTAVSHDHGQEAERTERRDGQCRHGHNIMEVRAF